MQRRPSYDGLVSSSSSRKDEEQQKFNELQEQEQAQALAATLQVVNVFLCYYAQSLCYYRQTHGTSPTSVSGFNNTIITGDVNISNTITNNDGMESESSITKRRIADPITFSISSEDNFWRKGGRPTSLFHENLSFRSCMGIRNRPHGSLPHLRRRFPRLLSTRTARTVPG